MPPDNELMNELKKELGLVQGVILLTTSLLGTGVFALPELAALAAGDISLWAWPLLIILIFPIAIVFAVLGRHFPHAGGVAHFVGMAFGPRLQRVISWISTFNPDDRLYVQYDRDRHLYADTRRQMFRHRQYPR